MYKLVGKHNVAKVFTDNIEETAKAQIIELCDQAFTEGESIRIMPDTHAGAGCTIGTTMTIRNGKIIPNLVGVDIGCGMIVTKLKVNADEINFDKLDSVIRKYVPSGRDIQKEGHHLSNLIRFDSIVAPFNLDKAEKSIGTLGGGNHFIEVNHDSNGGVYLVVHTGSRHLGNQIAKYYQDVAYKRLSSAKSEKDFIIEKLKAEGREKEIHTALRGIKSPSIKKDLAWVEGQDFDNYINDMKIAQRYALMNRLAIVARVCAYMDWYVADSFDTIHNYIDMDSMIMRKGAISAKKGERVIIPINMRDGSIIAHGKGNPDWNWSAPHGAGRVLSRSKARQNLNLDDFKDTMSNVWTTSVGESTIDEAPMAYKPMQEIIDNTKDTIEISDIIKPLYNFKAN